MTVTIDKSLSEVIYSPVCGRCVNLTDPDKHKCKAFPTRIPDEIWNGDNTHTSPVKGDHGIRFKAR